MLLLAGGFFYFSLFRAVARHGICPIFIKSPSHKFDMRS